MRSTREPRATGHRSPVTGHALPVGSCAMAEVIYLPRFVRERRRARERAATEACIQILEANLQLTLHLFSAGPAEERSVRARQMRQLAELLEYVTGAM